MKNILTSIFLILVFWTVFFPISYAENEEVLESQKDSLNISEFIDEANQYTEENLEGMDLTELLNSAITGKVENEKILKTLLKPLGKEIRQSFTVIRKHFSNCFNS